MTVIPLDRPRNTDRLHTIRAMLDRWDEAHAQKRGDGGIGGQFSSAELVWDDTTWTPAFQELERCLIELRKLAKTTRPIIPPGISSGKAWWCLQERYLNSKVIRREIRTRRTRSGHRIPVNLPRNQEVVARPVLLHGDRSEMLVRVWNPGVEMAAVEAALQWIEREYRGQPAMFSERVA